MASIYARNNILQIKYKNSDGAWTRKSTGMEDTPENRVMVRNELIPALEDALTAKESVVSPELFETYALMYLRTVERHKTYWEYHARVEKIIEYFKGRDIREIQVSELRVWISHFECSTKTLRAYIGNCKGIFDMAIQEELMVKNPFIHIKNYGVKKEATDIEPFSKEEVIKLLNHATGDMRIFLAIGFYAGLRAGEILGLQIADIEDDVIFVKRGISKGVVSTPKTEHSVRRVPLFDVLRPYLDEQIRKSKIAKSLWLFHDNGKHLYGVDTLRGKKPYGAWYKLLKELYINQRPIKNTRHTFIVAMLKSGEVSMLEIAQMVGHTNTKMIIEHYAKYINGEQLKISRSFNPFGFGHTSGHIEGNATGHTQVHSEKLA